jgi:hypothetical protein
VLLMRVDHEKMLSRPPGEITRAEVPGDGLELVYHNIFWAGIVPWYTCDLNDGWLRAPSDCSPSVVR